MRNTLSQRDATSRRKLLCRPARHRHSRDGGKNEKCPLLIYRKHIFNYSQQRNVGKAFGRKIERWKQSTFFMEAFTRRVLATSRLTLLVANFSKSHIEKTAETWSIPAKAKAVPPLELSHSRAQPSSLSPTSNEKARKKHRRALHMAQALRANSFGKKQENRCRYSPASLDRKTSTPLLGHQLPLLNLFGQPSAVDVPL